MLDPRFVLVEPLIQEVMPSAAFCCAKAFTQLCLSLGFALLFYPISYSRVGGAQNQWFRQPATAMATHKATTSIYKRLQGWGWAASKYPGTGQHCALSVLEWPLSPVAGLVRKTVWWCNRCRSCSSIAAGGMGRADHTAARPFPVEIAMQPVGVVRSPYKNRHGTPQQAVVTDGQNASREGFIELCEQFVPRAVLDDLDGMERIWVLSYMHLNTGWKPKVMPPRGARQKRGLFATRSPHRPNYIALSCVELLRVEGRCLYVRGLDLLDGTPVLDIKPYLPYADAFPNARTGWIDTLDPLTTQNGRGPKFKHIVLEEEVAKTHSKV